MLQVRDIHYTIGERELLRGINWIINPGRRMALIGRNGAGKTTLLRILTGELVPDGGEIVKPREYQIGYLPQEVQASEEGTIVESVLSGQPKLIAMAAELHRIHHQLEHAGGEKETLLKRLGELEDLYHRSGGYGAEAQAKAILSGLGFGEDDFERPVSEFSGGWRMRIYLARLLFQHPDLLLLDEPTNHLDIPALEWLEQFLNSYPGSIVIVSHDRFFINRLADEIYELEQGKLTHYPGNYQFYEQQKAQYREQLLKRWQEQQAERERIQRFIDRFRYKASKAAQVQSRIKMLEKMEQIEPPPAARIIRFSIRVETPSYKDVLHIEDLWFRYDQAWVLQEISLDIYRGERIALVGPNGVGKTTFTRLLMGELQPQRGRIITGERTVAGYYAQHQIDALNPDATVLEEVAATAAESHRPHLRDILGIFHFSGAAVDKPIRVLSGGEKARVSLAKILLSPVNLLIMDEPTNHLDMDSREALEKALQDYDGTLMIISHDRYFLDKLVNRVAALQEGRLRIFEGNYSDYLTKNETISPARPASTAQPEDDGKAGAGIRNRKAQKRAEAQARQAVSRERNRLQAEISALEQEIEEAESRLAQIETLLADPNTYRDGTDVAKLKKEYADLKGGMEVLFKRWAEAQEQLDTLLASINKQRDNR